MSRYPDVHGPRTDGRYYGCLTIDKKRVYRYGQTPADVQEQMDELRDQVRRGRLVTGKRQTVKQYLDWWLANVATPEAGTVRRHTHAMYRANVARAFKAMPELALIKLDKLRLQHIQTCYTEMTKQGYAPATVRKAHATLHSAFKYAIIAELMGRDPCLGAKLPQLPEESVETLSREEVQRLLEVSAGTRWHALWAVMCATGIRVAEASALRWDDLNERQGLLSIERQTIGAAGGGLETGDLKTRASRRVVPIPPGVLRALQKHRTLQKEERLAAGPAWEENGLIFPTPLGWLSWRNAIAAALDRACNDGEIPRVTPHTLRHTAITLLAEENKHPRAVQAIAGHKSSRMTMEVYTRVTPRMLQELSDTMEHLFFGATG